MKNLISKKKFMTLGLALLFSVNMSAQDLNLEAPAQSFYNSLKGAFPWLIGATFILCIIVNISHFVDGDWKKGGRNVLLFTGAVGVLAKLVQFVVSIRL